MKGLFGLLGLTVFGILWVVALVANILIACAVVYVAYEILFTDALNRWFG